MQLSYEFGEFFPEALIYVMSLEVNQVRRKKEEEERVL